MPYMVDSSYFVALKFEGDPNHEAAEEVFAEVLDGKYRPLFTTDYVLDEAVTVTRKRTKQHTLAVEVGDMITKSAFVEMQRVTDEDIAAALDAYRRFDDKELSFTDWVLVKHLEGLGWHGILAFDSDFEKVGVTTVP